MDIINNLQEQNKILKDLVIFCYNHKLSNKNKKEVIEKEYNKVENLNRKLYIKIVKQ